MKVTIADIARKAGVSKMTVSRVINKTGSVAIETKENIERIIREMDYHPDHIARSLSSKSTRTIGIVIPKKEKIFMDNYIAHVLSGVSEVLKNEDYRIMLFPVDVTNEFEVSGIAQGNMVDGLIILKISKNDNYMQKLSDGKLPTIRINNRDDGEQVSFIDSENIKGARLAMEYLYQKGHRKIGFICGRLDETNGEDRFTGYRESLTNLGLEYNENWVIQGDFDKELAYRNIEKLLALKDKPTAIFSSDDYMALGAIEKIQEMGYKVPDDFAVVGFDDIDVASLLKPALTTVQQPMHDLGAEAAQILLDIIRGKTEAPVKKFLDVKLIIRETT
ncbi:MAG: LacI family DNA-binding transcriptional regulator [Candidatus Marinimicrobia bacterium]|nr:LacI family DNA-binding transcriptional regulator [Candidatus Neomarinimicrobiota bacterium]